MQTVKLDEGLYRTDAENGVTVLTESMAGVRSVATGLWVKTASAHETRDKMGLSHLLEHMVFKGTERRSARDIAMELEVRGGSLDAFTGRDHTSYQARVLDEDLPRALDVLTDLVRNPVLRAADLELERQVVLEEINQVDDTPDDLVFDLHSERLWPDHSYGFPILGTRDTVANLEVGDLQSLHARAYHPGHVVIAAAGSLNHDVFLKLLAKCGWFTFEPGPPPGDVTAPESTAAGLFIEERDLVQTHVVLGSSTFPYADRRRYALMLLNNVLGGGMSSRLFQRVREELGLAYAVYAYQSFFRRTGLTGVYVGSHPSHARRAYDAILEELDRLSGEGLARDDLSGAKQQLKGQITLAIESPASRMYRAAGVVLYEQPYQTIDQVLAAVDAVSHDQVAEVAQEFLRPERQATTWLGPKP